MTGKLAKNLKTIRFLQNTFDKNKTLLIIFITVWLLSSTNMSRSFSSVLFNLYFWPKSVKVVNDFEEILFKPNLELFGENSLKLMNTTKPELYGIYEKRMIETNEKFKINYRNNQNVSKEKIISGKILSGEAVLFESSFGLDKIKQNYPHSKFLTTDDKYFFSFIIFYINKNHSLHNHLNR